MFKEFYGDLPLIVRAFLALFDYMVKASAAYKDTPEGAKEWQDVVDVYEEAINNRDGSNVTVQVQSADDASKDVSIASSPRQGRVRISN